MIFNTWFLFLQILMCQILRAQPREWVITRQTLDSPALSCPALTPLRQWAAVRTQPDEMRAPPQKKLPVPLICDYLWRFEEVEWCLTWLFPPSRDTRPERRVYPQLFSKTSSHRTDMTEWWDSCLVRKLFKRTKMMPKHRIQKRIVAIVKINC